MIFRTFITNSNYATRVITLPKERSVPQKEQLIVVYFSLKNKNGKPNEPE